jgi:polyisoprenyl-phosphate glycosyltransferase
VSTPSTAGVRIWFLSPVYFDVESYRLLRRNLEAELRAAYPRLEPRFVVVDDSAGMDPQIQELAESTDTQVLCAPFSLGHQRALVYGLRTLAGSMRDEDLVVTLDADGEDQPSDLLRLLTPLLEDPQGLRRVSLAARTKRRETLSFRVLYFFYKLLFLLLTGTLIRSGNYAAYRGWLARHLLFHPYFDLCYSSSLVAFNLRLERVPCARGTRYAGRSKMTYLKLIMHGLRMLMPFADRIAIRGLVGFSALLVAAASLGVWVVCIRLFTDLAIPGWATYTLLLALVLCGTALACLILLFTLFVQTQSLSMSRLDVHLGALNGAEPRDPPGRAA